MHAIFEKIPFEFVSVSEPIGFSWAERRVDAHAEVETPLWMLLCKGRKFFCLEHPYALRRKINESDEVGG